MMPYITAQFLTRKLGDRLRVVPEGSTNLALMGQFVEVPMDTVCTVKYSVRCAHMAVHEFMGTREKPKEIYMGGHNVKVSVEALQMLLRLEHETHCLEGSKKFWASGIDCFLVTYLE